MKWLRLLILGCIVHASTTLRAQISAQGMLEHMHRNVVQLPDCEFKYTLNQLEPVLGNGPLILKYHFSHYKGKFFYKCFREGDESEPIEWLAYDGNSFYRFTDGNLTIGKIFDNIQLSKPFNSCFARNPVFAPFYSCIFAGKEQNFSLPFLASPKVWVDALAYIKEVPSEMPGRAYQMSWPNRTRVFQVSSQHPFPTQCVITPNPDNGLRISTVVEKVGTYPTGQNSIFSIPEKLVERVAEPDKPARNVVEVVLDRESFRLISTPPKTEHYQIPRAVATTFYDSDSKKVIVR